MFDKIKDFSRKHYAVLFTVGVTLGVSILFAVADPSQAFATSRGR
jgi:hypothetical protein